MRTSRHTGASDATHPDGFVWIDRRAGTWAETVRRHLVVLRVRRVLWRSAGRYRGAADRFNVILAGRPGIAFQAGPRGPLYMARWGSHEHRVATGEWPQMWTATGRLITERRLRGSRTFTFIVRSVTGARLATLASGLSVSEVDQQAEDLAAGTFVYLDGDGDVKRTDGTTTTWLANWRSLGFRTQPALMVLRNGFLQLLSGGRNWGQGQVILRPDGRLFARVPAPDHPVAGFGALLGGPDGRAVADVLTNMSGDASAVYLIRSGDSAEHEIYRAPRGGAACDLPLYWHGRWLLFTPHGGRPILIDTADPSRVIRLPSHVVTRSGRVSVTAYRWASRMMLAR